MAWEYKVETFNGINPIPQQMQNFLNFHGKDDWEHYYSTYNNVSITFFFKRKAKTLRRNTKNTQK